MLARLLKLLPCIVLVSTAAHADSRLRYRISDVRVVDLGTLGGDESIANDINDRGSIVGWSRTSQGVMHAFLYRRGAMEDLIPAATTVSEARGINTWMQVVGRKRALNDRADHGFFWDTLLVPSLYPLDEAYTAPAPGCTTGSVAEAINDTGRISGTRYGGCPDAAYGRPALWSSAWVPWLQLDDFTSAPRSTFGKDINSESAVIIHRHVLDLGLGSLVWVAGGIELVPAPELPPGWWPHYDYGMWAYGLNDVGGVVGHVQVCTGVFPACGTTFTRAFFRNAAEVSSLLPVFPESVSAGAREINDQGFSVGWADRARADGWVRHVAVIWHSHFGIYGLPMPPGAETGSGLPRDFCEANSVNDHAGQSGLVQAVGYCSIAGKRRAILWNITAKLVNVDPPGTTP